MISPNLDCEGEEGAACGLTLSKIDNCGDVDIGQETELEATGRNTL